MSHAGITLCLAVLASWCIVSTSGYTVATWGSIDDVANARVTDTARSRFLNVTEFYAGFEIGVGTQYGLKGLGEFIALNGVGYTRCTNVDSANYYTTELSTYVLSEGMAILQTNPTDNVYHIPSRNGTGAQLWQSVYDDIERLAKGPYCYTGIVSFTHLSMIALARPPIDGRPVFKNPDYYYAEPGRNVTNRKAFVIGCAGNLSKVKDPALKKALQNILYDNPFDPVGDGLTVHSHVLLLNDTLNTRRDSGHVVTPSEVTPAYVEGVYHMLTASLARNGDITYYPIDAMTEWTSSYPVTEDNPREERSSARKYIFIAGGSLIGLIVIAALVTMFRRSGGKQTDKDILHEGLVSSSGSGTYEAPQA